MLNVFSDCYSTGYSPDVSNEKKWSFTLELERITTSVQRQKTATLDCYFTVLIHFASFDVKPICRDPHGPSVISIN